MRASDAIRYLDNSIYGGLDGFCQWVYAEFPSFTSSSISIQYKSQEAKLPVEVCSGLMYSDTFHRRLTQLLTQQEFSVDRQKAHVNRVIEYSEGKKAKASEAISAGRYLQSLRGTPIIEEQQAGRGSIINLNTGPRLTIGEVNFEFQLPGSSVPEGLHERYKSDLRRITSGESTIDELAKTFEIYAEDDPSQTSPGADTLLGTD